MLEVTSQLVIRLARLENHESGFLVSGQPWVSDSTVRRRRLASKWCNLVALKCILPSQVVGPELRCLIAVRVSKPGEQTSNTHKERCPSRHCKRHAATRSNRSRSKSI